MKKSVDFIGVGTGPFNLSIAALSHQIEELDCLFFDEHPHFSWHRVCWYRIVICRPSF